MSNATAIAAVTALLQRRLLEAIQDNNLDAPLGGNVDVSAERPDAEDATTRLNLFLCRARENPALRNDDLPRYDGSGRRMTRQPLALELYYVVSAYGADDFHAELLLGAAMQAFHEEPVFSRDRIRALLNGVSVGTLDLSDARLNEQVERVRITPQSLEVEAYSQLWSAIQSPATPSAYYRASVLLIEPDDDGAAPLRTLERRIGSTATLIPPLPAIERIVFPNSKPGAELGDTVTLAGHHLDGAQHQVRLLWHREMHVERVLAPANTSAGEITFVLPNVAADWPVGVYAVEVELVPTGATATTRTNRLSLQILPRWSGFQAARQPDQTLNINFTLSPEVRPEQTGSLFLHTAGSAFGPFTQNTSAIQLTGVEAPLGQTVVRVRVDGVESHYVDRTAEPPQYLVGAIVNLP